MSRTPLVIFGLTPFAEMVAHYFDHFSEYEVIAFTAHTAFIRHSELLDRPVISLERLPAEIPVSQAHFFAAIEYKWLNGARAQIVAEMTALGYRPASFIHPKSSVCPTAVLGSHHFIMEAAVLSYRSQLGDDNILFPQTFLGEAAQLGSHNYLCPGVMLNRHAAVENHCYIGAGSAIFESSRVGSWSYLKPRMEISDPVPRGTTFNPALRAPGYVVDRRTLGKSAHV